MNLTATSTEILLLTQKIESLESYLGWVIGGLGILFTLLVVLVGILQVYSTYRLNKRDVATLKDEITSELENAKGDLEKIIDKKTLTLQSIIDKNIEDAEFRLKKLISEKTSDLQLEINENYNFMEAELNRLFALAAESLKAYGQAFNRWVSTAKLLNDHGNNETMVTTALNSAEANLKKIDKEKVTTTLRDKLLETEPYLKLLEKTRPTEIKKLRKILLEKLESKPSAKERKK